MSAEEVALDRLLLRQAHVIDEPCLQDLAFERSAKVRKIPFEYQRGDRMALP